jgi:hypothetical protein
MKFAHNGKSVACGQWTSKMKTHFMVSVAHCSDNDKFNKARGKALAFSRMEDGYSIVLPAKESVWGIEATLKENLLEFLNVNC